MVVKNYQEKTIEAGYKREKQTIETSISSIIINENTDDYRKTMLYSAEESPSGYATTSGAYITKYLKVSRYCGDNNGDCFAEKYYEYREGDKKDYTPTYKGACANLKNGSSICIEPQTTTNGGVKVLIDVNGKKGPNVYGRDLRGFTVTLPDSSSLDRTSQAVDWNYKLIDVPPQCAEGVATEQCCEINFTDQCCTEFPEKYGSRSECKTCSATKGSDAECCTTSSEYANAHKSSCCNNISSFFESNKTVCCTSNPSDPRCIVQTACDTNPNSLECCKTKSITSPLDACCAYSEIKSAKTACQNVVTFAVSCSGISSKSSFGGGSDKYYTTNCEYSHSKTSQSYQLILLGSFIYTECNWGLPNKGEVIDTFNSPGKYQVTSIFPFCAREISNFSMGTCTIKDSGGNQIYKGSCKDLSNFRYIE